MKLSEVLSPAAIIADFRPQPQHKAGLVAAMLTEMDKRGLLSGESLNAAGFAEAVNKREQEGSTGVGEGFAFPHARVAGLKKLRLALFIAPEGLDFGAVDGLPVKFLIVSIVPFEQPNLVFTPRAAITEFLVKKDEARAKILAAKSSEEAHRIILSQDIEIDQRLLARDLMRPLITHLEAKMTIQEAAAILLQHKVDGLPVVDAQGRLSHEFTCHDLFMFSLPKFFMQLNNISYFKNMNPFEKYFANAAKHTLAAVQPEEEVPSIAPDATVMEMLFAMTTGGRHQLYVVDADKRLLGVVDRHAIVGNILVPHS